MSPAFRRIADPPSSRRPSSRRPSSRRPSSRRPSFLAKLPDAGQASGPARAWVRQHLPPS